MNELALFIIKKAPASFISWSFRRIFGKKNLAIFERLLELAKWKKVSYGPKEKWIFEDDNSFTIEISDHATAFQEPWTERFPNACASKMEVYLKIGGELVHEALNFISVDGGRYFVPMPKRGEAFDESHYYWIKDSLDYRVFKVIGDVANGGIKYNSLEEFGNRCRVLFR